MPTAADSDLHLDRFVEAQSLGVYERALAEIVAGRKATHWMWFIFPQLKGLGSSETAAYYGIAGKNEAAAYLRHPLLGPRLRVCTRAALELTGVTARDVFGFPDCLKLRSSMTLFDVLEPDSVFRGVLDHWFSGEPDHITVAMLTPR